jgi:tetratricopeptide (TPR) repeat protein
LSTAKVTVNTKPPETDAGDFDESRKLYDEAWDQMQKENYLEAIQLFEKSLALKPNYKTLLHLGNCLLSVNRAMEAIVPLAAATTLNRQGIAPTALAEALMGVGDPAKAQEMIDLALQRQPGYIRAQTLKPQIDEAAAKFLTSFD